MNRIYKLKFDKRRNELVVVSEITAGMGKEKSIGHLADLSALSPFRKLPGRLTPLALLTGLIAGLLPAMVLAAADLPVGGQIVGGQGSISSSGNQMTIHQQTQNMATNWHSFDIGKNNTVQFVQPDSSSVALNRVTGASGSQIMGTLKANGRVFILNPNGVLFGKGARVNVGGLVASTKHLSTADFMKGQYTLSGSGNPGAQVVNQGSLTTSKGGYIVLAGERVSNSGTVTTPSGKTVLAAGKTVTLQLDNGGLTSVSVNGSVVNALVENRGLISATDGQVYLTAKGQDMLLKTVVNNSGTVEAKGLASRGGEIVLNGGDSGVVSQSGLLLADSQTGQGGKITLEGQNIHLEGRSLTSATGKAGGGEVYAGGGWQGKDSGIRNASKVVMDKAATVDVSATENGNGGTAVLWSEDYTNFRGTVLAKGGARSGNGGKVETSSHQNLQASGDVDASARAGRGGEWLLDPTDVNIVGTGSETGIDSAIADGTDIFTPTAAGAQILNTSIVSQLNAGTNVTIKTSGVDTDGKSGNITVNADIVKNAGTDATLTLLADNNIWTKDRVSMGASTGKLNLNLLAGNTTNNASVSLGQFINISLNGGDFLAGAANAENGISLTYRNNGKIQGGNVTLNVSRGLSGYAWNARADNDLTVNGPVSASTGWGVTLGLSAGGKVAINSPGSISLQASETANGGGHVLISGDKGVSLNAANGNIDLKAADNSANHVNITSTSGDISMSARGTLGLTVTDISSTGGNISLMSDNTSGTSFSFTKTNITSSGGAVTLSALSNTHGEGLLMSNSSVSAKNDISGNFSQRVEIKQGTLTSEDGNITIARGISINGATGTNLLNTNVTAVNGTINLNGTSVSGVALNLNNVTLNATAATIKGDSSSSGTGFSLTNMSFAGALADLINVTLSSAGSAAGVVNTLDSSVVNDVNRDNLLAKRIENMTSVDMGGKALFDDSTEVKKGWTGDYTLADLPAHGWIFSNTSVKAGGQVALTGVGFSNTTMDITSGGLNITQSAPLLLTNTTINVSGGVLLHSDGNLSLTGSTLNEISSGDEDVNLFAGQNMTLSGAVINASAGKLNITLQAGEKDSAMVYLKDRTTLNSNGRNITIERGNNTATNPNAMAVKINNAVLNAGATDATQPSGDILISTLNPNVNLSQSQYNNTVRNAGVALELSGNASLTGRDLVLNATQEGGNAKNLPVFLNNATLTATRDITLKGTSLPVITNTTAEDGTVTTNTSSPAAAAIELRGQGNVLTAGGNIAIENQASGGNNGIYLNGSATGKTQLTANGTITLNGSSVSGSGVQVTNAILNASRANITGSSNSGTGFSLTNSTLAGALAGLVNVSLSSAGSGAGVMNVLDSSIVTAANRDSLLEKKIENMTTLEMGGSAIFDDSTKTDKGWKHNYTSTNIPNGGWVFNNTTVNAGGDVDLKGAAFTNATVTVSNGNLTLDNNGPAPLTGTTITVSNGAVSVHAGAGNIDLSHGNISANGDITLKADAGSIAVSGVNATAKANITSATGNISINTKDAPKNIGLVVNNVTFSADSNISIDAVAGLAGAQIRGANFTATKGHINLNGSASWGGYDGLNAEFGGMVFFGDLLFKAGTGTTINATHASHAAAYSYSPPVPLAFEGVNITFDGGAEINARGSYVGITLQSAEYYDKPTKSQMFVKNGDVNINATLDGLAVSGPTGEWGASASGAIVFDNGADVVSFDLDVDKGSNVTINADSSANKSGPFAAFAAATPESSAAGSHHNGFVFSGGGNISVSAVSDSADAVNLRLFNNENLTGNLAITGTSESGVGVNFDKYLSTKVSNATITGSSVSGVGVQMTAKNGSADLNGNSVSGSTATGKGGVILSGSNVTITNGTLTGNATDGNGSGISMVGGSSFTLDGATVGGNAVDGSGISVNGTLTVNNGTTVDGHARGRGNGVVVSGDLTTDSGNGITISGIASSGDGVKVDGDTRLTAATLTGHTDSGVGVNIAGNLTTDNVTQVSGQAASGTGVNLGAALSGATVEGHSDTGTGVQLADDAVVTGAVLKGSSTSGDGVAVTGNVMLDDTSAAALKASSTNGSGLKLADNANVSIQTITRVTQTKKDADGNPVLGTDGKPVTETVTTQAPVTTPVTLTGTSEHGTGIATEGNVSISGIVLNGRTTADTGTGVSLGGNLTIADDISGVTAGATGNGTALVVNNASIHSDGYTDSGKDFVINASVSGNGTAIKTRGSSQLDEVVLNGEATGGGTAVELGGQVSGANITGTSDSGTAVRVTDGAGVDDTVVKGHSDSGTGLQVSGNASLNNSGLSGTTQTGTGAAVAGSLTADNASQVTGQATQSGGTGVTVDGTVTGGTVTGEATSGDAVRIADGSQLTGADIKGTSVTGTGIKTQGNVTLEGGTHLAGGSEQGVALDVSGTLNHDPDSSVTTTPDNTGNVIGHENIHEVIPVVPPVPDGDDNSQPDHLPDGDVDKPAVDNPSVPSEPVYEHEHSKSHDASLIRRAEVSSQRREEVNAQVTQRSQPARGDFHSAGTPPVPVDGYEPAAQPVDISLCDGNDCQSESLDTEKPVKGNVTPSGR
ncbi:filamentous hemagglutinin N-terminal domain-containing protein [Salmonella enterica subsp. enterica serovar Abaetetuba]|nr:filamentous hemagglutinin N-terminal domain-containing protein [Salmonella enterica subsp. enterica serovar Abaetetuba]ECD1969480.1 filamentous hemagglutinin N-terminal domain-containing protein [Salmonella enterica subsp. enterica serovar Abaetetuba]EJR4304635.1 filamentous hemagglutinin N-terminal domain-containing protein [Salmonella enterica]EJR4403565.1 filamentous hemagglutinin N-terminal domain-containing protein [Salmonella enterica]